MATLKKNIFYSGILTTANYIFPLITYPYVSRVLGVANIGACNFVDSIINYFLILSALGIGTVGIREIAKNYNSETNWYYLNSRYYSPEFRRFISPDDTNYLDPETPNGLNLYCYCK